MQEKGKMIEKIEVFHHKKRYGTGNVVKMK